MKPGVLVTADGEVFEGVAVGAEGPRVGEAVFNTSMTGYQEVLSDPSYAGQIVVMTSPHIGNYGVSDDDDQAANASRQGIDHPLAGQAPIQLAGGRVAGRVPEKQ